MLTNMKLTKRLDYCFLFVLIIKHADIFISILTLF